MMISKASMRNLALSSFRAPMLVQQHPARQAIVLQEYYRNTWTTTSQFIMDHAFFSSELCVRIFQRSQSQKRCSAPNVPFVADHDAFGLERTGGLCDPNLSRRVRGSDWAQCVRSDHRSYSSSTHAAQWVLRMYYDKKREIFSSKHM